MVLLVSSIPKIRNKINKIFDSQISKQGKIFPGTNLKILKNNKTLNSQNLLYQVIRPIKTIYIFIHYDTKLEL